MRRWLGLVLRVCCTLLLLGQTQTVLAFQPEPEGACAENDGLPRDDISAQEEEAIWTRIAHLRAAGDGTAPQAIQAVTYALPLRLAPGLPDSGGHIVAAFADHDPASGAIRDYTGGARTYDGHQGTDFGLYPFKWNKVNAGEVQVVAAAAGKIVIHDNVTAADHNCGSGASGGGGNLIALEHADGRVTLYGHMRYNSLTAKGVGQSVAQGEYLGLVGSSGSSTGPHLHFEVRAANGSGAWIDPYAGAYSQAESLWTDPPAYYAPLVNRLSTLAVVPAFANCAPEASTNLDSFILPTVIYLYTFFRDYQPGLALTLNIFRPDGSLRRTWAFVPADNTSYPAMYLKWTADFFNNGPNSEPAGTWRFEVLYAGQTYTTYFNVNAPPSLALSSPDGGEAWELKRAHSLTWADNIGGGVNLGLYHGGAFVSWIALNTPSDGEYSWIPGPDLAPGAGYTVRVSSVINPALTNESSASFSLLPSSLIQETQLPLVLR